MLKRVIITNYLGESMEYAIEGVQPENEAGFLITSIEGLGPVKANINMTDLTTTDGQLYNSARLSGRNIVIKGLFTHASSIEEARLLSYKYFPIKKKLKIRVETDKRIGETEGYVESNEPDIFSEQSGCQISILCENPYFSGGDLQYTFSSTSPLFKFQFGNEDLEEHLIKMSETIDPTETREILYDGDADSGMEITVEIPSNDIMDDFSIIDPEIVCNGKKLKLDTSRMTNQVPKNTDTSGAIRSSYRFDGDRTKFMNTIPISDFISELGWWSVFYKGRIHVFIKYIYDIVSSTAKVKMAHFAYNESSDGHGEWEDLGIVRFYVSGVATDVSKISIHNIWSLNDTIYIFYPETSGKPTFAYFDDIRKEFVEIYDSNLVLVNYYNYTGTLDSIRSIVYNNAINLFVCRKSNGECGLRHFTWDETNGWVYVRDSDMDEMFAFEYDRHYSFIDSSICVYKNKIYIMGGCYINTSNVKVEDYKDFAIYDGNTWLIFRNILPFTDNTFYDSSIIQLKNKLYLFFGGSFTSSKALYIYDGTEWSDPKQNSVIDYFETSDGSYTQCSGVIADDNYIYIVGGKAYSETPSNERFIEGDRVVINTTKGKKSITLYRGNNEYNILNALDKDSTWLQLRRGMNYVSYNAADGSDIDKLDFTIVSNRWYEGV